jgi:hypothetical protein
MFNDHVMFVISQNGKPISSLAFVGFNSIALKPYGALRQVLYTTSFCACGSVYHIFQRQFGVVGPRRRARAR